MQKIKLSLIDENHAVYQALSMRLNVENNLCIVYAGPFESASTVTEQADVVLLGLTADSRTNIQLTDLMVRRFVEQETAVIILTPFINDMEQQVALKAGASRYLLKTINSEMLIGEITAVYQETQLK